MKSTRWIVGVTVVFILTGCATVPIPPSFPNEPAVTFRSRVEMPVLPPEPSIDQVTVPPESFVGVRYVPTNTTAATAGDIQVVVEPSKLGAIRTTEFKGEPLLIQPAGLIAWIVVRNQSSHIVDLRQSILQFEDDKGHEYAIEEGGWTWYTLAFIDSICEAYAREASALTDRYRVSLERLLLDVRARTAAAQRQNDDDLARYLRFIQEGYMPPFAAYVAEVNAYNRRNFIGVIPRPQGPVRMYVQKPHVIEVDPTLNPERLIVAKREERAQANRRLEQAAPSFQADIGTRIDALRARLLSDIETRRAEWKKAVQSLPLEATKVVRGNGQFDPIVIPPGKHRTLFVPGIRSVERGDRGTAAWPASLILKLYDLPARTDQAARVIERSTLEFRLQRESVQVFVKDESKERSPAR